MPYISTAALSPTERHPENDQVYNGLDACITLEVLEELKALRNAPPAVYNFERALQAPALAMMMRGFAIDEYERQKGLEQLRQRQELVNNALQRLAYAVWDRPLNPRSPKQLLAFFYGAMKLPEQWISKKGIRKLSMDREALEKLEIYLYARPIIACILALRDIAKQIEDFEQSIEDGRYYTSFNIAGTETWRFSSSKSARGTGGNLQNKKRDDDIGEGELSLRKPFIADPGWKLCEIDLAQAESYECGWIFWTLFGDGTYLDACEAGDLHTTVARMIWPDIVRDRKSADALFYRNYSYRDMAKRGGHLSNYYGTAWTAARSLKMPLKIMEQFQRTYATGQQPAFPAFSRWWRYVAQQLQTTQQITNSFGVTRTFFGRPNDDTTLREAIAHGPQSATAFRTNLGMWRIWRHMPFVQLLAQKHDSITFQYQPKCDHDERMILDQALALMSCPMTHRGRTFDVPCDCKVGWNWGAYDKDLNPNGMMKWKGADARKRLTGMERIL